jgi:hypothetical protein
MGGKSNDFIIYQAFPNEIAGRNRALGRTFTQ